MKVFAYVATAAAMVLAGGTLAAQQAVQPASAGQKSLAATMNVYVFPTKGQTPEQQNTDEATCYDWAEKNTGTDPFKHSRSNRRNRSKRPRAWRAPGPARSVRSEVLRRAR